MESIKYLLFPNLKLKWNSQSMACSSYEVKYNERILNYDFFQFTGFLPWLTGILMTEMDFTIHAET